jgi:hypothetical protein
MARRASHGMGDAVEKLVRRAVAQGWSVEENRNASAGHHRWLIGPAGQRHTVYPSGSYRYVKNLRAELRRDGVDV